MTGKEKEEIVTQPVTQEIVILNIFDKLVDKEMKANIEDAVRTVIMGDNRFYNADIETVDAIRDWVRAEVVLNRAMLKYMAGDTTASNERMFRAAMIQKNSLRDEIFGKLRTKKGKKEDIAFSNKILMDTGCIETDTEVDPLES